MQSKSRVPLTIRIDPKLRERVRREADRNRRTIGAEIMALLDAALTSRGPSGAKASGAGGP
jgi:hypothetical protein